MFETQKSTSMFETRPTKRKRDQIKSTKRKISMGRFSIGVLLGILLTLITIILQCIAFFTPHWKEITPVTHSLYVDGIDALIRTEILHYFNSVHRSTRQSYGLFQRCEYPLNTSSIISSLEQRSSRKCTKNYLPSYRDEQFNECHSLPYYKFCTKANEKNFNINNDYLRATFDISYSSSASSCDCQYPPYASVCHVIGILAIIFLTIMCLLFSLFSFLTNSHHRLKIKCFGGLASILAMIFLLINLILIYQHSQYESIEYLIAIERHYKFNQIYKLSQDTKTVIDRFLSSIEIRLGYSFILACIAFGLCVIDMILFLMVCKIKDDYEETDTHAILTSPTNDDSSSPLKFRAISHESPPLPPPLPIFTNSENETSRRLIGDEV